MKETIIDVTPTGRTKRGRYLLLVLALPACYYLGIYLREIFTISEVAILENNIASTEAKITTNSGRIDKLEQEIKEAQQAVTDTTSVNDGLVLSNKQRRALLKSLGGVSAPRDDKQASLPESGWLQAPSTIIKEYLRHCQLTKDGELVTDGEGNGILETPYTGTMEGFALIPDCGAFVGIEGCYLRQADQSNCYGEELFN